MHEEFIEIVRKCSAERTDRECNDMVSWLRSHVMLFEKIPSDIIADVIRHCEFERKHRDDVLIKQGENGDRLYIILKGTVSIYVIHDQKDDPQEILRQVDTVCGKEDLDRTQLGQYVWSGAEGKSFGEIALLKEDCIRTATVVADTDTDLVVIDRDLYNRSVRDVLEREYQQKTKFVEENTLFRHWPMKQKKLLINALKKETAKFGSYLIRQATPADNMFFLLSGEMEITCDQSLFPGQYEDQWRDMETLLPGLLPRTHGHSEPPHEALKRKKTQHKLIQMCLLGTHEVIGALDIILGLPTSLDNAMVTREAEVLLLTRANFERLFSRKYGQATIVTLRERLTMRLYMYIHRTDTLNTKVKSSFFKYLTFLLQDENALNELKKMKRKEREEKQGLRSKKDEEDFDSKYGPKEAAKMTGMLKMLDLNPKTMHVRLPTVEFSKKVIDDIEAGLSSWIDRSRGGSGSNSPCTASPLVERKSMSSVGRQSTFHGNDFLRPHNLHIARALRRSKTPI